jgi:hypothetical protein
VAGLEVLAAALLGLLRIQMPLLVGKECLGLATPEEVATVQMLFHTMQGVAAALVLTE